jgi:hypothetical protein
VDCDKIHPAGSIDNLGDFLETPSLVSFLMNRPFLGETSIHYFMYSGREISFEAARDIVVSHQLYFKRQVEQNGQEYLERGFKGYSERAVKNIKSSQI